MSQAWCTESQGPWLPGGFSPEQRAPIVQCEAEGWVVREVQEAGQPLARPPRGHSMALAAEGSGVCKGSVKHTHPSSLALVGIVKPPATLRDTAQVPTDGTPGKDGQRLTLPWPEGQGQPLLSHSLWGCSQLPVNTKHCSGLTRRQRPLKTSQGEKAKPVQPLLFWGALTTWGALPAAATCLPPSDTPA